MLAQSCGVGILRMAADDIINILFSNVVQDETRTKHVLIIKPHLISECTRASYRSNKAATRSLGTRNTVDAFPSPLAQW